MRWFWLIFAVCACGGAFAAESEYDGVYTGAQTVKTGEPAACGAAMTVSVTAGDSTLPIRFDVFALTLGIGPDGRFKGMTAAGGLHGGRRVMRISGRIAGRGLRADIGIRNLGRLVCAYHWDLKKS